MESKKSASEGVGGNSGGMAAVATTVAAVAKSKKAARGGLAGIDFLSPWSTKETLAEQYPFIDGAVAKTT